ncbi:unnamed protein product [Eruca vesicaria subsp. sativa]|uniref:DC1 domain-containing protein n=1 Tax=Eruca vesicaria subsp. sativa TaxID=29727 RepID=A0ABC8L1V5_ERUVS|nr:unnamed protein product [Eruca vesicaria subsp. sativa]
MDCFSPTPLDEKYNVWNPGNVMFYCTTCGVEFHIGCGEFPRRITHPCHSHCTLKFKKHNGVVVDIEKLCEAYVYPISSYQFYDCEECDYSLYEVCAGLPKKLDHASRIAPSDSNLRTVSSKRVLKHGLSRLFPSNHWFQWGQMTSFSLTTSAPDSLCDIHVILHYKFDKHPLTLSYGENIGADDVYWCEVCEKLLDPEEWFYTCDECCTTIHLQCLFGSDLFLKPGFIFKYLFSFCGSYAKQ